jgi:hypothetical protein
MNIEDLANYALTASDDDEMLELQAIVAGLLFLGAEEACLSKIHTRNPSWLYLCHPQLLPNSRIMTSWTQLYESYDNHSYITTMGFDVSTFIRPKLRGSVLSGSHRTAISSPIDAL